jgi:pilus assembly protein CpaB
MAMNKRFVGVLIFAFLVAAGGGLLTYRTLLSRPPQGKSATPMTRIVFAAHNLEAGRMVKEDDVKLGDWPGVLPEGASAKPQDFIGRGVIVPIFAKEAVIDSRLAAKGAGGGLAAMIPPGMRAFAVRVNDVAGVAGFVVPGMRVDVVINGSAPGGESTVARTLLQNVEVLSAGQDFKKDSEGKPIVSQVVTLVVSPSQAEQLSLAANQTTIQLVLRNPVDREMATVPGVALPSLFAQGASGSAQAVRIAAARPKDIQSPPEPKPEADIPHAAPAPPKAEPTFKMEIIVGAKRTEAVFPIRAEEN